MSDFMIKTSNIMYVIGESTEAILRLALTVLIIMIIKWKTEK